MHQRNIFLNLHNTQHILRCLNFKPAIYHGRKFISPPFLPRPIDRPPIHSLQMKKRKRKKEKKRKDRSKYLDSKNSKNRILSS